MPVIDRMIEGACPEYRELRKIEPVYNIIKNSQIGMKNCPDPLFRLEAIGWVDSAWDAEITLDSESAVRRFRAGGIIPRIREKPPPENATHRRIRTMIYIISGSTVR